METKLSDCWQTPDDLFQVLDKGGTYQGIEFGGFNFDVDLCANEGNSKCNLYSDDYLNNIYSHSLFNNELVWDESPGSVYDCCFINPPYSNPKPFIEKAWEDSKHCKIVCLVKVDPSTKWWATFWNYQIEYHRGGDRPGPKEGCEVIFFPKRIRFVAPEGLEDKSGPAFASCLVIMDRRGL